ncbi:MAG: SUMF1/EgtB/PvdO family nonheme iron enzyme [Planctomycetaceae bacterium]
MPSAAESEARRLAETSEEEARSQAELARETLLAVVFDLQAGVVNLPGGAEVRRRLLRTSLDRLDRIATRFIGDTAVQAGTCQALLDMGAVLTRFGSDDEEANADGRSALAIARSCFERTRDIARELVAAHPEDPVQPRRPLSGHFHLPKLFSPTTGCIVHVGPGPIEIVVIDALAVMLYGKNLPEVGRSVGQYIAYMRRQWTATSREWDVGAHLEGRGAAGVIAGVRSVVGTATPKTHTAGAVLGGRSMGAPPRRHAISIFHPAIRGIPMKMRRRRTIRALATVILATLAVRNAHALELPGHHLRLVGNPGNANDTTGYGAVGYAYEIGKCEVTIEQYADFLNAAARTDPYSLYDTRMASDLNIAGITRNGSSGSYIYSVIGGSGNKPITYVSWFDAARFANWVNTVAGAAGDTETGAYTLVGGQTSGVAPARNPGATFYIPTENEWYKAAYYSPIRHSGSGGYYEFATFGSNPGNVVGSTANQANYVTSNGIYSVTQSSSYDPTQNYLTDVGAFSNSASYYGTFDQSGNVYEWNDLDGTAGSFRGLRGGYWSSAANHLSSGSRIGNAASTESGNIGFRLVSVANSVPEIDPAGMSSVLALLGGSLGLLERRRKRC